MVERTALEMRHTCKGIVGSNPTLSAIITICRDAHASAVPSIALTALAPRMRTPSVCRRALPQLQRRRYLSKRRLLRLTDRYAAYTHEATLL